MLRAVGGRRGNFAAVRARRRMLPVSLGLCGAKELSCAARRATWLLTELSNVVAYACRHSQAEDRRHAHRSAFFGCPSTGDQSFSHQRFPSVKTGCANCANCANPPPWAAHPVPAIGIAVAETAETPTDAQRRRPPGRSTKRPRKGGQDGGQESPSAGLVAYSLPYMPVNGGEGGIRTHGTLARTTVFETVPIDHSGTSPGHRL
jgi:hypothetical protein